MARLLLLQMPLLMPRARHSLDMPARPMTSLTLVILLMPTRTSSLILPTRMLLVLLQVPLLSPVLPATLGTGSSRNKVLLYLRDM